MSSQSDKRLETAHRFLDEAGDTTFYCKGIQWILGTEGVSLIFGMTIARIDRQKKSASPPPKRDTPRRHGDDFQWQQTYGNIKPIENERNKIV